MPGRIPANSPFARSLADFCGLACRTSDDPGTTLAVAAAAAVLEAEFDAVVAALEERQALLQRLAKIQQSITRRAELQDTLDAIVAGAAELLDEPVAALRLIDPDDPGMLEIVSSVGLSLSDLADMRRSPVGAGAGGLAVAEERLVVVEDYQGAEHAIEPVRRLGGQAAIGAPVRERGRVVGSLAMASRKVGRTFSAYEQEALIAFAEHASLALTDARMVADAMHQAVHDALTGLPNRVLFSDRIDHALAGAQRRGTRVAVLFLDLDNFKVVNDSLGHEAGDKLLVAVAERLAGALRACDTVARFGGDEFGILLEDVSAVRDAERVAEEIGALMREPFVVGARQHVIGASIGIALSGPSSNTPDALVRDADAAMYRAKLRGRAGHEVFDEEMRTRALARLRTEDELRHAITAGELCLVYQPIVSLTDGLVVGAEALVRWQHPERGLLAPREFIAIAEDSGLIVPMGDWVLREACRAAAAWDAEQALYVSVNLSPRQIGPRLIDAVAAAVTESGLEPGRLALEITESVLLEDSDTAHGTLKALKALGTQIVLDDFGTGYSSLGYLKRLPLDGLKIDRSFVGGLGTDADDSAIVSAVAGMAGSLGLTIIAEGVETVAQVAELRRLDCQRAQGYHFAGPLNPAAFEAMVAPRRRRRSGNTIRLACPSPRPPSTP
jgi:diguanylate cyclase (GGDEF)-like protein